VVQHNGTPNPLKISPPDLDRLIAAVTDKTTLEASVYISQGHPKWVMSCPTFTWEFDLGSQKWNERRAILQTRWRASAASRLSGSGSRATRRATAALRQRTAYDEFGNPLVFQIESGPVVNFPNRTKVARADFNFVVGVGQATGQIRSRRIPASAFRGRTTAGLPGAKSSSASSAGKQRRSGSRCCARDVWRAGPALAAEGD
jgi:hypothetical protein